MTEQVTSELNSATWRLFKEDVVRLLCSHAARSTELTQRLSGRRQLLLNRLQQETLMERVAIPSLSLPPLIANSKIKHIAVCAQYLGKMLS